MSFSRVNPSPPSRDTADIDIGVVAHNLVDQDGQGLWMLEIVRALVISGHKVTLYCIGLDEELAIHPSVTWVRQVRRVWGPQLLTDIRLFIGATMMVRSRDHDLVCLLGSCALPKGRFLFFAAFSQAGWRRSWKVSGGAPDLYRRFHSYVNGCLERIVVGRASGVVAMSLSTAKELSQMQRGDAKVCVSPGGVDPDVFHVPDAETVTLLRGRWGIPSGSFVVAFVGEFRTARKGLIPLALALDGLQGVEILVRGSGDPARIKRDLDERGCSTYVRFIGEGLSQDAYQAADAVAIPSLYEPFSLVAMEAAASGLPVIISKVAGASSLIASANAGILVDPLDGSSIRTAVTTLMEDRDLARSMGERARSLALQMRWPTVSSNALGLLQSMTEEIS